MFSIIQWRNEALLLRFTYKKRVESCLNPISLLEFSAVHLYTSPLLFCHFLILFFLTSSASYIMKSSKFMNSVGIFGFGHTLAQSTFIPSPSGLEHVLSQRWPGASIDYKQVQHFLHGLSAASFGRYPCSDPRTYAAGLQRRQFARSPPVLRRGAATSRFQHQFKIKLSIHVLHSTSTCSSGTLVGDTLPFLFESKLINSLNRVTPRCGKCANSYLPWWWSGVHVPGFHVWVSMQHKQRFQ